RSGRRRIAALGRPALSLRQRASLARRARRRPLADEQRATVKRPAEGPRRALGRCLLSVEQRWCDSPWLPRRTGGESRRRGGRREVGRQIDADLTDPELGLRPALRIGGDPWVAVPERLRVHPGNRLQVGFRGAREEEGFSAR